MGKIGIGFFSVNASVRFNIFEGVIHEAAVTAVVAKPGAAVHEVLF